MSPIQMTFTTLNRSASTEDFTLSWNLPVQATELAINEVF